VIWECIFADLILRLAVWWKRAESNIVKLYPIYSSVKISAGADWLWQYNSTSVNCLENTKKIASTGDLLDQDWC